MKKIILSMVFVFASVAMVNANSNKEMGALMLDCNDVAIYYCNAVEIAYGCLDADEYGDMYEELYNACMNE